MFGRDAASSSMLQETGSPAHRRRLARYALRCLQLIATLLILVPSVQALNNYYTEPAYARDDYRGIVTYIQATGRPGDAILLNAPGQQEVFGYYYQGDLPVHPLPESRPLDPARTATALADLARPGGRVFALLWATDESDPDEEMLAELTQELAGSVFEHIPEVESLYLRRCTRDTFTDTIVNRD